MKDEILAKINRFDKDAPEWCLPPMFWQRAEEMSGYTVFPLGDHIRLPIRKCHTTSLIIVDNGKEIGLSLEYCTGYACSDGIWCRHAWVIHNGDKTLLESTPNQYERYYGVVLDGDELEQFKEIIDWKQIRNG